LFFVEGAAPVTRPSTAGPIKVCSTENYPPIFFNPRDHELFRGTVGLKLGQLRWNRLVLVVSRSTCLGHAAVGTTPFDWGRWRAEYPPSALKTNMSFSRMWSSRARGSFLAHSQFSSGLADLEPAVIALASR
jgi:hypothetical protein